MLHTVLHHGHTFVFETHCAQKLCPHLRTLHVRFELSNFSKQIVHSMEHDKDNGWGSDGDSGNGLFADDTDVAVAVTTDDDDDDDDDDDEVRKEVGIVPGIA
jgi:hypothetical protein